MSSPVYALHALRLASPKKEYLPPGFSNVASIFARPAVSCVTVTPPLTQCSPATLWLVMYWYVPRSVAKITTAPRPVAAEIFS